MGKKINVASFLCGGLSRKKNQAENSVPEPVTGKEDSDPDPGAGASPSSDSGESPSKHQPSENAAAPPPPLTDQDEMQKKPLPPPPGRLQPHHVRAASCHHERTRSSSSSGIRRVSSSLSMRMLSSASRREELEKKKRDKMNQEDTVWKKTIILGEKCRVPDEEDDTVLYDEKGKKISTYHPKATCQISSFSRQNSSIDQDSVPTNDELSRKK